MKIEFVTKSGQVLGTEELREASDYYEAACTAEYLADNYAAALEGLPDETVLKMGYVIREKMADNNETEEEALYEYFPSLLSRAKTGML